MSSGLETQTNNEHKLLSSKPYTTCLETNPIKTKISFREYDEIIDERQLNQPPEIRREDPQE